jgi:hypothetical protein
LERRGYLLSKKLLAKYPTRKYGEPNTKEIEREDYILAVLLEKGGCK